MIVAEISHGFSRAWPVDVPTAACHSQPMPIPTSAKQACWAWPFSANSFRSECTTRPKSVLALPNSSLFALFSDAEFEPIYNLLFQVSKILLFRDLACSKCSGRPSDFRPTLSTQGLSDDSVRVRASACYALCVSADNPILRIVARHAVRALSPLTVLD